MTDEKLAELVRLLRLHVPPAVESAIPRKLGGGRCLPSTRLGLEVCRYFEVKAWPLPTRALAVNEAWQEWMHGEAMGQGEMPEPAWSVAVGWDSPGRGVDMHLVLLVEEKVLLDLDSSQFSRPQHKMPVAPTTFLAAGQRPHPVTGEPLWYAGTPLEGGGRLDYVEHPNPPQWKSAPDWRKVGRYAGPIIRTIRAELG